MPPTPHEADPARRPASDPARTPPQAWKLLLTLLSVSLCLLVWASGLRESLERPSVLNDLTLRQLELSALAGEALPEEMRTLLVGQTPREELAGELEHQIAATSEPAPALRRLELALLRRGRDRAAMNARLRELTEQVDPPRRPLLEALVSGERHSPEEHQRLLAPWSAPLIVQQLSCEQLGGPESACPVARQGPALVLRLAGVGVVPVLFVILGVLLLVRQGWLRIRGRLPEPAPLRGPPLSPLEATLLIAGGFVVLGELLTPLLLQLPLQALLRWLAPPPPLDQGIQVVVLYLGLMLAPLTILGLLLKGRGPRPAGGWLQWGWRPPASLLLRSTGAVLMVLPVVALAGWLIEKVWPDPGGSNPLLDLVLTSADPIALACFAGTAIVLAPLFEETLFRGALLPVVAERLGGGWAVLISAAVFAIAHLSLGELVPLFVLGLGLGWLRWRSGRLGACVLMHAFWNALTFLNLLLLAG